MDFVSSSAYLRSFLIDLKQNNNREWLHSQEKRYQLAKKHFLELTIFVLEQMQEIDPQLVGLEAKNCIFRQARDIRFSKDKTPYKTHFSFAMASGGKKGMNASYYLHFDPQEAFVGGGIYMPPPPVCKLIREEIDYNADEFLSTLHHSDFAKVYGQLDDERVKSMPKGYEKDHPMADFIRLKSYTAIRQINPSELGSDGFPQTIVNDLGKLVPLIHFLNRAIDQRPD
jgi:uncharacterized protein (TIGR02453 family)